MNNENENNNIESRGIENKDLEIKDIQGKDIQKTEDIGFGTNRDNEHVDTNNVENALNEKVIIEENLNPWLSIWTKPRKTMRYIMNNDPSKHVILLAMIFGIIDVLDRACEKSLGDNFSFYSILLIAILFGSVGGIIYVYLNAVLIKWTGKWIGGNGTIENIRAAIVWGSIPYIFVSILWIPELILFGEENFTSATPIIDSSLVLSTVYFLTGVIEFVFAIWSMVVGLKCLGEVQGFSAWKALGNYILAGLVIIVPMVIILLIVFLGIASAIA